MEVTSSSLIRHQMTKFLHRCCTIPAWRRTTRSPSIPPGVARFQSDDVLREVHPFLQVLHDSSLTTREVHPFLQVLHDSSLTSYYEKQYSKFLSALADASGKPVPNHWDGDHLVSSATRPIDGSVLHAIASFGSRISGWGTTTDNDKNPYHPLSEEVAKTITKYNDVFCKEYPVNNQDTLKKVPGVLYGRYPGDHYAGGNPWQLLSAGLAEVFYLAAKTLGAKNTTLLTTSQFEAWYRLFNPRAAKDEALRENKMANYHQLAQNLTSAGDAVLSRVYEHVKTDGKMAGIFVDRRADGRQHSDSRCRELCWPPIS